MDSVLGPDINKAAGVDPANAAVWLIIPSHDRSGKRVLTLKALTSSN
jgi:hypothetical protein